MRRSISSALCLLAFFLISHPLIIVAAASIASVRNDRAAVLFILSPEPGLSNAALAAAHSTAVNYPNVTVHIASPPAAEKRVLRLVQDAASRGEESKEATTDSGEKGGTITYHRLDSPSALTDLTKFGVGEHNVRHPPPSRGGYSWLLRLTAYFLQPWSPAGYAAMYAETSALLAQLDPALVVMDMLVMPAVHAVRDDVRDVEGAKVKRRYAFVSPNDGTFLARNSYGQLKALWNIPPGVSDFSYPVRWRDLLRNALYMIRTIAELTLPRASNHIRSNGAAIDAELPAHVSRPSVSGLDVLTLDVPVVLASRPEIEYPLPWSRNMIGCGPIPLELPVAADDELRGWMAKAPTVLVNLGSLAKFEADQVLELASALAYARRRHPDVQILWKLSRRPARAGNFIPSWVSAKEDHKQKEWSKDEADMLGPLGDALANDKVRVVTWLNDDPTALMRSGHVVLYVHHGGANAFHEALITGVPSVILPPWFDCYDYAVRAEWLGVGIWGSRTSAPSVNAQELGDALRRALGDDEEARNMQRRALEVRDQLESLLGGESGPECAARNLVGLIGDHGRQAYGDETAGKTEL